MLQRNKKLSEYAKKMRRNMTPWERKLWFMFLQKHPLRFKRQYIIGNYIADFYCEKANLVIELDGSGHYQDEQKQHDSIRDELMKQKGLSIFRISNYEIDTNFEGVCYKIDELAGGVLNCSPHHRPPEN